MKKTLFILVLMGINDFYSQKYSPSFALYIGVNSKSVTSTDFSDFCISDWQYYGLMSENSSNQEGRILVPLNNAKPKSSAVGLSFGFDYSSKRVQRLNYLFEFQGSFSRPKVRSGAFGINFDFIQKEKFTLGITTKILFTSFNVYLGVTKFIDGYVSPVVLPNKMYGDGDILSYKLSGFTFSPGLTSRYVISDKMSILGYIGWNLGDLKSSGVLISNENIDLTQPFVVKNDGTGTQAGIKPKIGIQGLNFQVNFRYTFNGHPNNSSKLID